MEKSTKRVIFGCAGAGCLGLIGLSVVGAVFLFQAAKGPEDIVVNLDVPTEASKGEEFVIEVEIENTADKPQKLESLDIADEYLAGIAIQRTDPPFSSSLHVPIDNSWSYEYHRSIPAKGKLNVKLYAKALKVGDFAGDLDVCINSVMVFSTYPLRTVVDASGAPSKRGEEETDSAE